MQPTPIYMVGRYTKIGSFIFLAYWKLVKKMDKFSCPKIVKWLKILWFKFDLHESFGAGWPDCIRHIFFKDKVAIKRIP